MQEYVYYEYMDGCQIRQGRVLINTSLSCRHTAFEPMPLQDDMKPEVRCTDCGTVFSLEVAEYFMKGDICE